MGGRSISLSSLIILIVWQLDNVPGPNVGGFTRFVAATRSKNLLSSLEREREETYKTANKTILEQYHMNIDNAKSS